MMTSLPDASSKRSILFSMVTSMLRLVWNISNFMDDFSLYGEDIVSFGSYKSLGWQEIRFPLTTPFSYTN